MKKLMIAAAVAASTISTFAGLCDDVTVPGGNQCFLWNFRANVKTLTPAKVTVAKQGGSLCGDDVPGGTCAYLVATKVRQFAGIAWLCASTCPAQDIHDGSANLVIWENSSKLPITAPLSWDGTTFTADVIPAADESAVLFDRFGINATAVEVYWPLPTVGFALNSTFSADQQTAYAKYVGAYAGTLTLAGFGALPSEKPAANFAVINGYCVANWQPECGPTKPDFCTALGSWCAETDATNVAGYGVWSLTYNGNLSKGGTSLKAIVPDRAKDDSAL